MNAPTVELGLTTREVCELTGLSYRQVDYWSRHGVLDGFHLTDATPGTGRQRMFDYDVVFYIRKRLAAIADCPNCGGG